MNMYNNKRKRMNPYGIILYILYLLGLFALMFLSRQCRGIYGNIRDILLLFVVILTVILIIHNIKFFCKRLLNNK